MRKPYTAPVAKLELFVPVENITTWKYNENGITQKWWSSNNGLNFWGAKPASNANGGEWLIDGTAKEFLDD